VNFDIKIKIPVLSITSFYFVSRVKSNTGEMKVNPSHFVWYNSTFALDRYLYLCYYLDKGVLKKMDLIDERFEAA